MFTGKKNQIVLLIINFFPKIASLPLPNPIYHWNGLPLQKDINLHICAVLSWRNGGPAREKQPRRSRSAALHSDFKHLNLPAGHSSAAAMLPSVFLALSQHLDLLEAALLGLRHVWLERGVLTPVVCIWAGAGLGKEPVFLPCLPPLFTHSALFPSCILQCVIHSVWNSSRIHSFHWQMLLLPGARFLDVLPKLPFSLVQPVSAHQNALLK